MKDKKERKNSKEEQINIKNIIKENIKIVIGIVLGIILISGTTAYGATILFASSEVSYDNTTSGMRASNVQSALDELYVESTSYQLFEQRVSAIENKLYPVGSIYISMTDDTVAKVQNRMGGTWEVFGKGKTLVGLDSSDTSFDTIGETGGEKTHTLTSSESGVPSHTHNYVKATGVQSHTLTINEMPTHRHDIIRDSSGSVSVSGYWHYRLGANTAASYSSSTNLFTSATLNEGGGGGHSHGLSTSTVESSNNTAANASSAHNNLQPYITVYMYKRTS